MHRITENPLDASCLPACFKLAASKQHARIINHIYYLPILLNSTSYFFKLKSLDEEIK